MKSCVAPHRQLSNKLLGGNTSAKDFERPYIRKYCIWLLRTHVKEATVYLTAHRWVDFTIYSELNCTAHVMTREWEIQLKGINNKINAMHVVLLLKDLFNSSLSSLLYIAINLLSWTFYYSNMMPKVYSIYLWIRKVNGCNVTQVKTSSVYSRQ